MPGDLTTARGPRRDPFQASGGDSLRRKQEYRPGIRRVSPKPEKLHKTQRSGTIGPGSEVL